MKSSIICTYMFITGLVLSSTNGTAQSWTVSWDDPIPVNTDEFDNNRPKISVNANEEPVIIWGKDNGRMLFFSKWDGASFTTPQTLVGDGVEVFTADWAGPEIGGNGDNIFAVFKRYPENEFGVYAVKSTDGGQSWSDTMRVDNVPIGDMQTRFPKVVVDDDGNPAITLMTFEGNYLDPTYQIITSADGGNTFSDLLNTSTDYYEHEVCDCCTADIVYDGTNLVQLYRNNDENIREIKAVVSQDWGQSVDQSYEIDGSETFSNFCFSSGPSATIQNGTLITTFRTNTDVGPRVAISSLDLTSGSLGLDEQFSPNLQPSIGQTNPKVAGYGDIIGVVWQEETTNDDNVMFKFSSTGLAGIFEPDVSVLNLQLPGKQINPDIKFMDGVFHVVWQDKATGLVMYRRGNVTEAVGVEESVVEVAAFPNPTNSTIQISLGSHLATSYKLSDITGKILQSALINSGPFEISLVQYSKGTYILDLYNGDLKLGESVRIQRQ